jgi:hypothetical protein
MVMFRNNRNKKHDLETLTVWLTDLTNGEIALLADSLKRNNSDPSRRIQYMALLVLLDDDEYREEHTETIKRLMKQLKIKR